MTQYVIYKRVSTARQGQSGLGLAAQQIMIDAFVRDAEVIGTFTDVASGSTLEGRPELEKAIDQAVLSKATLIVAKADRLSRNVVDALTVLDRLGGKLLCCDCPETNRLMLTMQFAFAEHERLLISIRTTAAMAVVKIKGTKSGEPVGRKPGARVSKAHAKKAGTNKTAIFRAKMDAVIEIIRHWTREGKSLPEIRIILNVGNHKNSRGGEFSYGQVRRLLDLV